MITDTQREERKSYIGGSDIGAILGLSKYDTKVSVYQAKVEGVTKDLSDNEAVHFGNVLEDVIAAEFARRLNVRVARVNDTVKHRKHGWAAANIDRRIMGLIDGQRAGLECKNAGHFMAEEFGEIGSDEVPDYYLAQCCWYMEVLGYDVWYLAVLIGGNEFRWYKIKRDQQLIDHMLLVAEKFWNENVLAKVAPAPVNQGDVERRWPRSNGNVIVATEEIATSVAKLRELKAKIKELTGNEKSPEQGDNIEWLELQVKTFLGANDSILVSEGGDALVTYSTVDAMKFSQSALKDSMPDVYESFKRPSSYRKFDVKKPKKSNQGKLKLVA